MTINSPAASSLALAAVSGQFPAGPGPEQAGMVVAAAKAHNSEVIGKVVDDSIEASARARRQREAEDAERRAEEARQARFEEIERRERAEAQAVAEENKRIAAQIARQQDEKKAEVEADQRRTLLDSTGRLDAAG